MDREELGEVVELIPEMLEEPDFSGSSLVVSGRSSRASIDVKIRVKSRPYSNVLPSLDI